MKKTLYLIFLFALFAPYCTLAEAEECRMVLSSNRAYLEITKAWTFENVKNYHVSYGSDPTFDLTVSGGIRARNIVRQFFPDVPFYWNKRNFEFADEALIWKQIDGEWKVVDEPWQKYSAIGTQLVIDYGKFDCEDPKKSRIAYIAIFIIKEVS